MNDPITATEALARGKTAALKEAYRLIDLNAAHGAVLISCYPTVIMAHVTADLMRRGYSVKDTPNGKHVSWVNTEE